MPDEVVYIVVCTVYCVISVISMIDGIDTSKQQ